MRPPFLYKIVLLRHAFLPYSARNAVIMTSSSRILYQLEWTTAILGLISLICSSIVLYLIYKLGKRNGFLLMIFGMAIAEVVYDISFLATPFSDQYDRHSFSSPGNEFNIFMGYLGGLSGTLFSNVLAGSLYYIAAKKCVFDVEYLFWNIAFPSILCFSLTMAIVTIVFDSLHVNTPLYFCVFLYYVIRLVSILLNIIIYTILWHKLKELGISGKASEQGYLHPLWVLSNRLMYYPVIQVVSRVGAAWYEAAYVLDSKPYDSSSPPQQTASLFCFAILTPIAGILYLAAFLYLQPQAYDSFIESMCCKRASRTRNLSIDSVDFGVAPASSTTSITQSLVTVDARNNFTAVQLLDEAQLMAEIGRCFSSDATVAW